MYICDDCREEFKTPAVISHRESHGEDYGRQVCPHCGSEDFTEARACVCCQEYFLPDDLTGRLLCKQCLDDLLRIPDLTSRFARTWPDAFAEFYSEEATNV